MNEKIEASDRSIAASEITNSIITTGNNSPVFLGYERLRDAVIQPDGVFKAHIESFMGRRWLIDQVDSILNDENNSCGYLKLKAHAGLGKTAFLAWLVKERNYIHHFVELAPGQEGIEKGLKNLAAQIILAYKLNADEAVSDAIPDAAGRPEYLSHLLFQAAKKIAPGERIVVVVDALDEAGTPPGQNVLGLPRVLPDGVFFIVSMRPVQVTLYSDRPITPSWTLEILAESTENLDDMKSFLQASADRPKVKQALDESRFTADQFIDSLMKKSGGLWIYLHFVIPEIERGERSPLHLDKLPEGLPEYYKSYWDRWREDDKWYKLYLPILTTLAAAQESSTLERILDWAGIVAPDYEKLKLRRILKEKWRPFLAISGEGEEEKYRFYHATVKEFFEGKAKQNSPMATENDLLDELSLATRERHRVIAECYLARWGGLEKRLPDLVNKIKEEDGYGLRHLAAHLEASGQDDELHHLLKLETSQGRNLWHEAKEVIGDTTGYINDVIRARRLAEERYDPENIKKTGKFIGLQNRYALIFASINSLSGNIPSELLLALVENGIWSKEEGLAHARHVPDREDRARILAELSSILKEPKLLDEALAIAREIQIDWLRAQALVSIAPQLPDAQKREILDEALAVARDVHDYWAYNETLASIAPQLPDEHDALAVAREISNDSLRAQALAEIAPQLPDAQKREVLDEALATAREIHDDMQCAHALASIAPQLPDKHDALAVAQEISNDSLRAQAFAEIAPQLPDAQKKKVLDEALAIARAIQEKWGRTEALATIAPRLPDAHEALATAREIQSDRLRAQALAAIAPQLPDAQKKKVLDEAQASTREIQDDSTRAMALSSIAPQISDVHQALATVREIQDDRYRAQTLAAIAPQLPDTQKRGVLDEALATAREIQDDLFRVLALASIASRLPDAHEALAVAREIQDDLFRVQALASIAPELPDAQTIEVLDEALAIAREISDDWRRAEALASIAPELPDAHEALATAREIQDDRFRAEALASIALELPDPQTIEVLDEALAMAREIQDDLFRVQALASIAPELPDAQTREVLDEALAIAREIQDDWYRAEALASIVPELPDAHEALAIAREIQEDWCRAEALASIVPRLHDAQTREVLDEALVAARETEIEEYRAHALERIVFILLIRECLIYSSLWPSTIRNLSIRRRDDLLIDLSSLSPLVAKLGGDEALLETIQAIEDVGRWWP